MRKPKASEYFNAFKAPFFKYGKTVYFARRRGSSFNDEPEEISLDIYNEICKSHILHLMITKIEKERARNS